MRQHKRSEVSARVDGGTEREDALLRCCIFKPLEEGGGGAAMMSMHGRFKKKK